MADKKIVLVVGASSGFGELASEKLLHLGCTVYTAARRVERMKKLEALGGRPLKMDVTDDAIVQTGVARIIAEEGRKRHPFKQRRLQFLRHGRICSDGGGAAPV